MPIDTNTPTADLLKNRPELIRLAQAVFDRPELKLIKAFTQFTGNDDLALVIEARRKGFFNYGATISFTNDVPRFPRADAVLRAIELALDERYDEIDLRSLGMVDDQNEILTDALERTCPSYAPAAAPRKARVKKETVVEPTPALEPVREPEFTEPSPAFVRAPDPVPSRSFAPAQEVSSDPAEAILSRLDMLSNGIADALTTHLKEVKAHVDARVVSEVQHAERRVMSALHIVNENLRTFAAAIYDPGIAEEMPKIEFGGGDPEPLPTEAQGSQETALVNEALMAEIQQQTYSERELRDMSMEDLKILGAGLGIEGVENMNFRPTLVRELKKLITVV